MQGNTETVLMIFLCRNKANMNNTELLEKIVQTLNQKVLLKLLFQIIQQK